MSVISGFGGSLSGQGAGSGNGISGILKWGADPKASVNEFASSATGRAKNRVAGNDDWSGSYSAMGFAPYAWPGQTFNFAGAFNGNAGSTGNDGYTGGGIVDEFNLKLDVEGGKEIMHDVKYSGNGAAGALTPSNSITVTDTSIDGVYTAVGLGLQYSVLGSGTWITLDNIRTMDLSIKSDNKAYNSSTTNGHTSRVRGNADFTFSFSRYFSDPTTLFPVDTVVGIRMYVTPSLFYEFMWGIVTGVSGIEADVSTAAIVGATTNLGYVGTTIIGSTPTPGWVKAPVGYGPGAGTYLYGSGANSQAQMTY